MKPRLSRYLDGEMPVRERARIENHVQAGDSCRKELERLQSVSASLEQIAASPEAPQGFATKISLLAAQRVQKEPQLTCIAHTPPA
ncbi:MAG: anti-sigma factor family protein [Verrucomicrobiota bacterium]